MLKKLYEDATDCQLRSIPRVLYPCKSSIKEHFGYDILCSDPEGTKPVLMDDIADKNILIDSVVVSVEDGTTSRVLGINKYAGVATEDEQFVACIEVDVFDSTKGSKIYYIPEYIPE